MAMDVVAAESADNICKDCPFKASIESARRMLDNHGNFHKTEESQKSALGNIAMLEEVLVDITNTLECDKPKFSASGPKICPNELTAREAVDIAKGPSPQTKSYFNFDQFLGGDDAENPTPNGQYL